MKALLLFAFFVLTLAGTAQAGGGDSVGRGGVIWQCVNPGGELQSGILTDLYEAQLEYQLTLIQTHGTDPMALYRERRDWLTKNLPEFASTLASRFDYVEKHLNFVDAELLPTDDFHYDIRPNATDCGGRVWTHVNIANFREENQTLLISKTLWNNPKLPTLDRAALLFHEAIYYWMRSYFGATTSDKSRHIVGVLFSTKTPEEMKEQLRLILGAYPDQPDGHSMCVMKNTGTNKLFIAYDQSIDEAQLTVRLRCQDEAEAMWCSLPSIACEDVPQGEHHRCISQNNTTKKIFVGVGRGLIEAQFNAHMSCFIGSLTAGASPQDCPDLPFIECN